MTKEYRHYALNSKEKADVIEKIAETLAKEEVDLAILFGSFIELDGFRDIDIAIYTKSGTNIDRITMLTNKLEEVLKIPVHIVSMDKIRPGFELNTLRKGVIVFEKPGIYKVLFMQTIDELILQTIGLARVYARRTNRDRYISAISTPFFSSLEKPRCTL